MFLIGPIYINSRADLERTKPEDLTVNKFVQSERYVKTVIVSEEFCKYKVNIRGS